MTKFDIIGTLRTYAAAKGWIFLSGASWYQNYQATQANLTVSTIVLGVDFDASPTIINKSITSIRYRGTMMLGRKKETTTESSQDETFIQKYDNRLLALTPLLASTIGDVACTNELEVTSCDFKLGLNMLDENLDFVIGNVTLTQ